MIDPELLELLACPACREAVRLEGQRLVCAGCGRAYPIRDDIPIMLLDESELPGEGAAGGEEPAAAPADE